MKYYHPLQVSLGVLFLSVGVVSDINEFLFKPALMSAIYEEHKDEDGFLYIT
jgi:hypothetical protein